MSYTVRDDNATFGPLAGVELPNGAGASTLVAHQIVEVCGIFGVVAATGAAGYYDIFQAPPAPSISGGQAPLGSSYRILGCQYNYSHVGGASYAFALEVVPAGTADGSGVNPLGSATYSLTAAVTNTPFQTTLAANSDTQLILPGSRVNVILSGTATGVTNLTVCVYIARIS